MKRRFIAAGAGIALALALTACAGAPMSEPGTTRPPFHTSPGPLSSETLPSGIPTDVSSARWDAIVDDLASRGVTGEPTLVSAEAVTWPTGALGCATPGQNYTQATVDGMRVVVEVDGTTYDYRFGETNAPKLCEQAFPSGLNKPRGGDGHTT